MTDLALKIKRIALAAEARGIKANERRIRRRLRRLFAKHDASSDEKKPVLARTISSAWPAAAHLRHHRLGTVRPEARAMHLACAFLRGRPYQKIEAISRWPVSDEKFNRLWKALWERVRYHVTRHMPPEGSGAPLQRLAEWEDGAMVYARSQEAQAPSLGAARAGSRAAKDARRWPRRSGGPMRGRRILYSD